MTRWLRGTIGTKLLSIHYKMLLISTGKCNITQSVFDLSVDYNICIDHTWHCEYAFHAELKNRSDEQSFTCKFMFYRYHFLSTGVRFLCRLERSVLIYWLNYFYRGPTGQSYKRGGADAWWELGAKAINLQFTEVARDISGPFR
jgi:hypothetical protein